MRQRFPAIWAGQICKISYLFIYLFLEFGNMKYIFAIRTKDKPKYRIRKIKVFENLSIHVIKNILLIYGKGRLQYNLQ